MFRQAIALLTYRKRSTIFMILLLAFVFFLLGSVPALFAQRDHIWLQGEADSKGIFDGIYFSVSADQKKELLGTASVQSAGFISHYGEFEIPEIDGSISVGSLDKTAIELGRVDAVEGHLPEAEGEIALEEMWRNRLPEGAGIGSILHVQTSEGGKEYILCGFIENYTEEWAKGLNTNSSIVELPNAIVWEKNAPWEVVQTDTLVYFHHLKELGETEQQLGRLAKSIGLQDGQVSYNELLYNRIPPEYGVFQSVFILAILAGAITVSYISLSFYVRSYKDVARKLYMTGATGKDTRKLLLIWICLLSVGGLLLGLGFHAVFSAITKTYLQFGIPVLDSLWTVGLTLAGLAGLTIWFHKRKIEPLYGASLSRQNEQTAAKEIKFKRHMNFSFAMSRAKGGQKRLWGVYVSIAVILALFLCVREDINNRLGLNFRGYGGNFSFRAVMRPITEEEGQVYGDFLLTKEKNGFSTEEVEELLNMPGVKSAGLQYFGMYPSLLLKEKGSAYAKALYEQDAQENRENTAPDIPEGTWATVMDYGGFNILVLDGQKMASLQAQYPGIDVGKDLEQGKAIVFCKPIKTELGITVTNDLFREGGDISFGWLEAEDSYEAAVKDPSLIRYMEESFHISQVIENEEVGWPSDVGKVVVVISKETAQSGKLCSRVSHLKIDVDMSITEKNYTAIKTRLDEMVRQAFGMRLDETKDNIEYNQEVVKTVLLVQNFLLVILSSFMLYALFIVLHSSFAQYRQDFGILRAVGYRKRALFSTILQEFLLYWAQLIVVCYAVVLWIESIYFYRFIYDYWSNVWDGFPYIFRTATAEAGIFAAATLLICLLAAGLFTQGLWRKSISSSIRFSE